MALGVQIVVEAEQQDQRSDPASTALRLIPSIGTPQRAKTLFAEGRIIHSRRDQAHPQSSGQNKKTSKGHVPRVEYHQEYNVF